MPDDFITLPQAETDRNDCFNISLSSSVGNEHILHCYIKPNTTFYEEA